MNTKAKVGLAAVITALFLSPTALGADVPCKSSYLDTMLKKFNDSCRLDESCAAWKAAKMALWPPSSIKIQTDVMRSWWNQMVGSSWATVGPRSINFGGVETGNVVTPTKRTFYSLLPSADAARTVTIKKVDGRSRTVVYVCTVDPNTGTPALAGSALDIPKDAAKGKVYTVNLRSATRQFVVVEIQPKTLSRSFKYELRLN